MKVHHFDSTEDAYDASQASDDVATGDVLVIASENVVGIADTWPVSVTPKKGQLHAIVDIAGLDAYASERGWPSDSVATALAEAAKLGDTPDVLPSP